MKIFTKICLAVCLVLFGIGVLCIGAGTALGSGFKEVQQMADAGELNVGKWYIGNGPVYHDEDVQMGDVSEVYAQEQVDSLRLDIQYGEVIFSDSSTENIEVNIHAPKRNAYSCENNNGTLKVKDKTRRSHWNIGDYDVVIEISVPEGKVFDEVKIKTDAGRVNAEYKFHAKNIDLDLGAGELVADGFFADEKITASVGAGNMDIMEFSAEKLKIDCGVGNAKLTGNVEEKAEADCGVGNLTLTLFGTEEDYNYEIDCGVGEVHINGDSYSGLSERKDIDNEADKDIRLDCGVGQLKVKTVEWEESEDGTEKTI